VDNRCVTLGDIVIHRKFTVAAVNIPIFKVDERIDKQLFFMNFYLLSTGLGCLNNNNKIYNSNIY
jgi:hypothetical protein